MRSCSLSSAPAPCVLQVNVYTHVLSGNSGSLGHEDLSIATVTLRHFSIILICEWLDKTAAILALHLGWTITDFNGFHEKVCAPAINLRIGERFVPWLTP